MTEVLGLVALILAACTLSITYWQGKTAHQKMVLDLFERRLKLYKAVGDFVRPIQALGKPTPETIRQFAEIRAESRFLFGTEVHQYLDDLYRKLDAKWIEEDLRPRGRDMTDDERQAILSLSNQMSQALKDYYETFPRLCEPYMKMDQKLIDGPVAWWRETIGHRDIRPARKHTPP